MTRIAIDPDGPSDGLTAVLRAFAVDPARLYFFDPDTGQAITG